MYLCSENKSTEQLHGHRAADLRLSFRIYAEIRFSHDATHMSPYLSRVMRKPTFCICENKDADQLRGDREADQRLCFRFTDSPIPLLSKTEISSP